MGRAEPIPSAAASHPTINQQKPAACLGSCLASAVQCCCVPQAPRHHRGAARSGAQWGAILGATHCPCTRALLSMTAPRCWSSNTGAWPSAARHPTASPSACTVLRVLLCGAATTTTHASNRAPTHGQRRLQPHKAREELHSQRPRCLEWSKLRPCPAARWLGILPPAARGAGQGVAVRCKTMVGFCGFVTIAHALRPRSRGDGVVAWLQQRVALVLQSHQGDASGCSCVVHVDLYSAAPMALACGAEVPVGQVLAAVHADTGVPVANLRLVAYGTVPAAEQRRTSAYLLSKHQKSAPVGGCWRLPWRSCCELCCCTCSWRRRGWTWRLQWCRCGARQGGHVFVSRWMVETIPTRFTWYVGGWSVPMRRHRAAHTAAVCKRRAGCVRCAAARDAVVCAAHCLGM